jgi:putative alpha-1,2-mannosidase
VNGQKAENAVIQSAKWNNVLIESYKISHKELMEGGTLEMTMTK